MTASSSMVAYSGICTRPHDSHDGVFVATAAAVADSTVVANDELTALPTPTLPPPPIKVAAVVVMRGLLMTLLNIVVVAVNVVIALKFVAIVVLQVHRMMIRIVQVEFCKCKLRECEKPVF